MPNKIKGIYGIKNKSTCKVYVGQSTNVRARFTRHKSLLKHQKHYNQHLQRAYNKYGKDAFEYVLLVECDDLNNQERHWIAQIGEETVYNLDLHPEDNQGQNNRFYGKTHSEETKLRMSLAKKNKCQGAENANFGTRWGQEARKKMSGEGNHNCKITNAQVDKIKNLLSQGIKHAVIAEIFGISRPTVTKISSGTIRRCNANRV